MVTLEVGQLATQESNIFWREHSAAVKYHLKNRNLEYLGVLKETENFDIFALYLAHIKSTNGLIEQMMSYYTNHPLKVTKYLFIFAQLTV